MVEFTEKLFVSCVSRREVCYSFVCKKDTDHGSNLVHGVLNLVLEKNFFETFFQVLSFLFQLHIIFGMSVHNGQQCFAGAHGQRIAGKCSGLINRPVR